MELEEWPIGGLDVAEPPDNAWRPFPFRQFILKVHSRCNLSCTYCYVYAMGDQTWRSVPTTMSQQVIARVGERISQHVRQHDLDHIEVVFHGGEPLLAGVHTLREAASVIRRCLPSTAAVSFATQTNGVLLNANALRALAEEDIRVAVSLDGTRRSHDRHRRKGNGRGSHAEAVRAVRLLGSSPFRRLFAGLLCVIDLEADPVATYEELLEFAPPTVDFLLPHANWTRPPPGSGGGGSPRYGEWLVRAFDRWYRATRQETAVRLFTEIINAVLGGKSATEQVGLSPVAMIVVDTAGRLEQVDTLRSAYHGAAATDLNVFDDGFDEALGHPAIIARQVGLMALADTCHTCRVVQVCGGGHYAHRYRRGSGFRNPSVYCGDLKHLIDHVSASVRRDLVRLRETRPRGHRAA